MSYQIEKSPAHIFRAYDIRGKVDSELNANRVYTIGRAFGPVDSVVIARDGRLSGPELLDALEQGLIDGGMNVINVGAVPTPVCYFAAEYFKTHTCIMLTGSHNPKEYNGMKMCLNGQTLFDESIQALYQLIQQGNFSAATPGSVKHVSIIDTYIQAITNSVHLNRPLKIAIDCGNGITGALAPDLFKTLGCEVIALYADVDGNFPNHHPDPSKFENIQELKTCVQKNHCDIGLAFDGDGDRLGVITARGEVIWPDRQMILFAGDVLNKHPGAKIIYDVKCSQTLPQAIKQAGGIPIICKTGHSFVKNAIKKENAALAGEMSGHIFFNDDWYGFDDGLYAGVRLLKLISAHPDAMALFNELPNTFNTPEINIPVEDDKKFEIIQQFIARADFPGGEVNTLDGLRVDFPDGFGLIRASNTTPNLVLRFEGHTQDSMERIRGMFMSILAQL